jgi:hypothetical protein
LRWRKDLFKLLFGSQEKHNQHQPDKSEKTQQNFATMPCRWIHLRKQSTLIVWKHSLSLLFRQTVAHLHSPLAKLMRAFRPSAYNQNENNTIIGAQSLAAMVRLNAPRFSKRSADK